MLYCLVLNWLRQKYIQSKFYVSPNINEFYVLMSTKNETIIKGFEKHLHHAFELEVD